DSRPSSSPLRRTVGGRPTLRRRSEAFRCTICRMVCLKLKAGEAAPAPVDSPMGIDSEEDLAVLDWLRVFYADFPHDPRDFGLDLVHDFHGFDDTDRLARGDPPA